MPAKKKQTKKIASKKKKSVPVKRVKSRVATGKTGTAPDRASRDRPGRKRVVSGTTRFVKTTKERVNAFSPPPSEEHRPIFTGRKLVVLNQEASGNQIERQAGKMSLKLASSRDFSTQSSSTLIVEALEQADGIVFEKLKIAVVNSAGNERLSQLTTVNNSHFRIVEPERYVYAIQAKVARIKAARASAVTLADNGTATWGIQAINVLNKAYTGKGVKIAILDTGFNLSHPDFKNRVKASKSFIQNEAVEDGHGHGSHCTGIAAGDSQLAKKVRYGVAREASIYIGKVLSNKGSGQDSSILAGIEWALENNCQVISMSLGSAVQPGESYYQTYESVAKTALQNNCLIIAAAGNESDRRHGLVAPIGHPANCPSIMAVGALTQVLQVAYFSCGSVNPDGQVDIAGPGVDVLSSWKNKGYQVESGTSMATPFVAGLAALLWEINPRSSASDIWMKLTQNAQRLPIPASDAGAGLGYAR